MEKVLIKSRQEAGPMPGDSDQAFLFFSRRIPAPDDERASVQLGGDNAPAVEARTINRLVLERRFSALRLSIFLNGRGRGFLRPRNKRPCPVRHTS